MGFEAQASGESAVSIQGGYTLYGGEKDISGARTAWSPRVHDVESKDRRLPDDSMATRKRV